MTGKKMLRDELKNYATLAQDEKFKLLLDALESTKENITFLPAHFRQLLIDELGKLKGVRESEKLRITYFMRRLQLQGNSVCFGSDGVFFRIVPAKNFRKRLGSFFSHKRDADSDADRVYKEFRKIGEQFRLAREQASGSAAKKMTEELRAVELPTVLDRVLDRIDTNLHLSHMALEQYLCWLFTNTLYKTASGLDSLPDMIAGIRSKELLNILGLSDYEKDQSYFLFRLNMPPNHMLYGPTIMDAGFGNKHFQPGGKTKPVTEDCAKAQYEWVVKGRPSFAMIKEVYYIETELSKGPISLKQHEYPSIDSTGFIEIIASDTWADRDGTTELIRRINLIRALNGERENDYSKIEFKLIKQTFKNYAGSFNAFVSTRLLMYLTESRCLSEDQEFDILSSAAYYRANAYSARIPVDGRAVFFLYCLENYSVKLKQKYPGLQKNWSRKFPYLQNQMPFVYVNICFYLERDEAVKLLIALSKNQRFGAEILAIVKKWTRDDKAQEWSQKLAGMLKKEMVDGSYKERVEEYFQEPEKNNVTFLENHAQRMRKNDIPVPRIPPSESNGNDESAENLQHVESDPLEESINNMRAHRKDTGVPIRSNGIARKQTGLQENNCIYQTVLFD